MRIRKWKAQYVRLTAALAAMLIGNLAAVSCGSSQELELTSEAAKESPVLTESGFVSQEDTSGTSDAFDDSADSSEAAYTESADGQDHTQTEGNAGSKADETVSDAETTQIYVDVCGAVENPGVYCLKEGDRVVDAVQAAGGFTLHAAETSVNQARILTDQEQLYVYTKEELEAIESGEYPGSSAGGASSGVLTVGNAGGTAAGGSAAAGASGGAATGAEDGRMDLNTATAAQLETLPGIGEAKAKAIVTYREENGYFRSAQELKNVSGIGDATYAKLEAYITVR